METRLGQGRENSKDFLKANPKIANEIEKKIREKYNLPILVEIEKKGEEKLDKAK